MPAIEASHSDTLYCRSRMNPKLVIGALLLLSNTIWAQGETSLKDFRITQTEKEIDESATAFDVIRHLPGRHRIPVAKSPSRHESMLARWAVIARNGKTLSDYAAKWIDRLLQRSFDTLQTIRPFSPFFSAHFAADFCNTGTPVFRASCSRSWPMVSRACLRMFLSSLPRTPALNRRPAC